MSLAVLTQYTNVIDTQSARHCMTAIAVLFSLASLSCVAKSNCSTALIKFLAKLCQNTDLGKPVVYSIVFYAGQRSCAVISAQRRCTIDLFCEEVRPGGATSARLGYLSMP